MDNSYKRWGKVWNSVKKPLVLVVSVVILFLFGITIFLQNRIAGDGASHLLLAVSPLLKMGSPYKDIWEIKPPVLPLVLFLWSSLFGFGILSMRIVTILIASLVVFVSYHVYKKIFLTPIFEIVFCSTIIIVLSPILNFLLSTELLGLLISLGALLALIGFKKDFPRFYLSGLLFFAASQTKEPFSLTVLAVLPFFFGAFLKNGFRRVVINLTQFLLGILTCFMGIYIYLASLGSVKAYLEVFKFKQTFYPFKFDILTQNFLPGLYTTEITFTEFSRAFSILLILAALSFYLINKYKKTLNFNLRNSQLIMNPIVVLDPEKTIKYSIFFYALGSFLGFGLGRSYGSHYLIQVVVPFYMMGGLVIDYLFKNVTFLFGKSKPYFYIALIFMVFSLIVIAPKRQYFSSYLPKVTNFSMTDQILGFERRITELTTKDQCVLSVYGWGVGENYLYSMRKPCTRFFLANIVTQDWQKNEYRKDILENPPALIVYQTAGADMNIQKFESGVINICKIKDNCYIRDSIDSILFLPKSQDIESLKKCIKDNSV